MKKTIINLIILVGIIEILKFLHIYPNLAFLLYTLILLFFSALLCVIIYALVSELKIFQMIGLLWKKTGTESGTRQYLKINYKNIEVSYCWRLQGGGLIMAHEFVHIVSQRIGRVEHVFEYCSGPGFIGFSLLANNLCDKLTLADVNPAAIETIKETIKNNNLEDRVTVYQSDCLDSIPENEQWDLVVGNPPWDLVPRNLPWYQRFRNKNNIMVCDPDSRVHKKFFQDIHKFLKPNGSILFIEGGEYTNANCFKQMLEQNRLKIIKSFRAVSFLDFFKNFKEYQGVSIALVILLRLGLYARQVYFIWSKSINSKNPNLLDETKGAL
ncbi:MAG: tRNA (adenine(22)-N(1))-methyltransferase TrmK [Candidatus Omnitrophica bacterium]|nr:tRNA (adenine(22)-N(1))-methyltransferase TrmK [Candidatus Omnitrophota bacterium]